MENEKGQWRDRLGDICTKRTAVRIALLQFRRPTARARARESRYRFHRFRNPLFVRNKNTVFPRFFSSGRHQQPVLVTVAPLLTTSRPMLEF
jgi:hypothetical protein